MMVAVRKEQDASTITEQQIEVAIEAFRGDILQIPSMYSALKHNGQPLYKLARQGIEIEREPRPVTVFKYNILDFRPGPKAELDVEVHVSKGTYVRSLAEDLGNALGCGAHVSALHRNIAGPFTDTETITLEELQKLRETVEPTGLDVVTQAYGYCGGRPNGGGIISGSGRIFSIGTTGYVKSSLS